LLPRHRESSNRVLWSVFAPSRQGGAENSQKFPRRADLPNVLFSWFQGLSRLLVARTDNYGGGWPRGTQRRDRATVALFFVSAVVLDLAWWGAGAERESATRPCGRWDSNTEVNRQFGVLTRHTRPDLLPRHRESSNRVLWSVFAPSRQGGAEKVRNSPEGPICQTFCSAGFKA
jgi:hypothetical protein